MGRVTHVIMIKICEQISIIMRYFISLSEDDYDVCSFRPLLSSQKSIVLRLYIIELFAIYLFQPTLNTRNSKIDPSFGTGSFYLIFHHVVILLMRYVGS